MKERLAIRALLNSETAALRSTSASIAIAISAVTSSAPITPVELDFSEVRFVSRSFAHSLLTHLHELENRYSFEFSHMTEEVEGMLKTVREQTCYSPLPKNRKDLMPSEDSNVWRTDFFSES